MFRILIADDDVPLARALELYLAQFGFQATVCHSDTEVRSTFADAVPSFDLALIDFELGTDCGADTSDWLLSQSPTLGVVLMSGYPKDSIMRVDSLGPRAVFLQKPFHPSEVISCLRVLNPMLAMRF